MSCSDELLVLAGGFGTRLRSAVSDVPKPLAPVYKQPYLYYLIDKWVSEGVSKFTFLLHHQSELIEKYIELQQAKGKLNNCEIRISKEPEALGTGGAVAYAVKKFQLSGTFLVANADTWLTSGIERMFDVSTPSMAIVSVENSERYGHVEVDMNNKIVAFKEKEVSSGTGWINAGLYRLNANDFYNWNEQAFSLERELFPKLVDMNELSAIPLDTDFIDIGVPEDYFRFCNWIESGKKGHL